MTMKAPSVLQHSDASRKTIGPVFVLLQEVWEGQKKKGGEKEEEEEEEEEKGEVVKRRGLCIVRATGRSLSAIVVTELLSSTRAFSRADWVSFTPGDDLSRRRLVTSGMEGGRQHQTNKVGVSVDAIPPIRDDLLSDDN